MSKKGPLRCERPDLENHISAQSKKFAASSRQEGESSGSGRGFGERSESDKRDREATLGHLLLTYVTCAVKRAGSLVGFERPNHLLSLTVLGWPSYADYNNAKYAVYRR